MYCKETRPASRGLYFLGVAMRKVSKVIIVTKPLGIAMPKLKEGQYNLRVQGGHAPVPYRTRTTSWADANRWAKAPEHGVWAD